MNRLWVVAQACEDEHQFCQMLLKHTTFSCARTGVSGLACRLSLPHWKARSWQT